MDMVEENSLTSFLSQMTAAFENTSSEDVVKVKWSR